MYARNVLQSYILNAYVYPLMSLIPKSPRKRVEKKRRGKNAKIDVCYLLMCGLDPRNMFVDPRNMLVGF